MAVGRSRSDSDALGGVVNGYAPLDSNLLIPPAYLPTGIINLSPISDTYISQNAATTNYETATLLSIADRISAAGGYLKNALFKFDLSSLTDDVIRADLYLHQEATTNAGVFSGHIGVRKVLRTVVMAEATYNVYSTGNSWTGAGCRGNTDAVQWFDTTFWSSPGNATVQWMVIDATATIRRAILDGDTSIVLQVGAVEVTTGSQNPLDIASQDNATAANRPILSVVTGGGGGGGLADHTHAATGTGSDGGGATIAPTTATMDGLFRFGASIDSTVDANQNDFTPGSLHAVTSIRFTSFTAGRTITGIEAGSTGELIILVNNTSFSLLLPNESGSSSAANRFRTPNAATHTVRQSGAAIIVYLAGRWTVMAA